jgi:aspartate/methionine/tyrosine aminotransferase
MTMRAFPPQQTTIFERMSQLARETGAINLGQGFPDLPEPPELIEAARHALVERSNQYPPMRGLAELREAIAGYYATQQGLSIGEEQIVVTSGATEALAAAIFAIVQPGDEVILVQPLYDAYLPLVRRAGGIPRLIDLAPPDWAFPLSALKEVVNDRTRLLFLNTPNNPTGTMLDRAMLAAIGQVCVEHDILLLCDEVWEAMVLDGTAHVSPLALPGLRERSIKIGSAGKIFSLTGWKVGWAVASPEIARAIAAQHQFLTFTTATPLQWAVAQGLALPPNWHAQHRAIHARAKARLVDGLTDCGYHLLPASASWFVTIDLAASGLPEDDTLVAEQMIREAGVAAIPVSAFYAERAQRGYLRLCFAKQDETIDASIESLGRFLG